MTRVAINGFGRIGRNAFKVGCNTDDLEFVAFNDLSDTKSLAYLLRYDSVYGRFQKTVEYDENHLIVNGKKISVYQEKNPADLPWKELEVDVVLECTGIFRTEEAAKAHLDAGAKRVVISAPSKGGKIQTFVIGVNEQKYSPNNLIVDNASCTTNCIAPVTAIMQGALGIEKALMTTVHAYTAGQNLVDGPNKDLRRGRTAAVNIVPTTTGAALATTKTIPELENKFDGIAIRVPVPVGSLSDITMLVSRNTTVEEVNQIFVEAKKNPLYSHVLDVTDEPLVSSDIIGSPYSSIVDLSMTKVVDGNLVKIVAWYDNEWGYSNRLVEMARLVGKSLSK